MELSVEEMKAAISEYYAKTGARIAYWGEESSIREIYSKLPAPQQGQTEPHWSDKLTIGFDIYDDEPEYKPQTEPQREDPHEICVCGHERQEHLDQYGRCGCADGVVGGPMVECDCDDFTEQPQAEPQEGESLASNQKFGDAQDRADVPVESEQAAVEQDQGRTLPYIPDSPKRPQLGTCSQQDDPHEMRVHSPLCRATWRPVAQEGESEPQVGVCLMHHDGPHAQSKLCSGWIPVKPQDEPKRPDPYGNLADSISLFNEWFLGKFGGPKSPEQDFVMSCCYHAWMASQQISIDALETKAVMNKAVDTWKAVNHKQSTEFCGE